MAKQNLYVFEIQHKITEKIEEKTDAGILLKEVDKEIPVRVVIKRPNSQDILDLRKIYQIKYSECIKDGILNREGMRRALLNSGNFDLSDFDRENLVTLISSFNEKRSEFMKIQIDGGDTSELKTEIEDLTAEIQKIQLLMNENFSYDNTAEAIAEREQMIWAAINLSFYENNEPVFVGATWKQKWNNYIGKCDEPELYQKELKIFNKSFLFYFNYLFNSDEFVSEEQFQDLEAKIDAFGT